MTTDDDRVVRRLDRDYASRPSDDLLTLATALGYASLEFPVGLLLAGSIVRGKIARQGPFGVAADAYIDQYTEAFGWDDEDRAPLRNYFQKRAIDNEVYLKGVMGDLDQRSESSDPVTIDDLALDEVEKVVRARNTDQFIELVDASIQTGGNVLRVSTMRVAARQVAAWWPLTAQPDTGITFG